MPIPPVYITLDENSKKKLKIKKFNWNLQLPTSIYFISVYSWAIDFPSCSCLPASQLVCNPKSLNNYNLIQTAITPAEHEYANAHGIEMMMMIRYISIVLDWSENCNVARQVVLAERFEVELEWN